MNNRAFDNVEKITIMNTWDAIEIIGNETLEENKGVVITGDCRTTVQDGQLVILPPINSASHQNTVVNGSGNTVVQTNGSSSVVINGQEVVKKSEEPNKLKIEVWSGIDLDFGAFKASDLKIHRRRRLDFGH